MKGGNSIYILYFLIVRWMNVLSQRRNAFSVWPSLWVSINRDRENSICNFLLQRQAQTHYSSPLIFVFSFRTSNFMCYFMHFTMINSTKCHYSNANRRNYRFTHFILHFLFFILFPHNRDTVVGLKSFLRSGMLRVWP